MHVVHHYNPNISTKKEYDYRASELKRLIKEMPLVNEVDLEIMEYDDGEFYDIAKGYEECKDQPGGDRGLPVYRGKGRGRLPDRLLSL